AGVGDVLDDPGSVILSADPVTDVPAHDVGEVPGVRDRDVLLQSVRGGGRLRGGRRHGAHPSYSRAIASAQAANVFCSLSVRTLLLTIRGAPTTWPAVSTGRCPLNFSTTFWKPSSTRRSPSRSLCGDRSDQYSISWFMNSPALFQSSRSATGFAILGPDLPFEWPPTRKAIFRFRPGLIAGKAWRMQFIDFLHLAPSIESSFVEEFHRIALPGHRAASSWPETSPASDFARRAVGSTAGAPSQNPTKAKSARWAARAQSMGHALNLILILNGNGWLASLS